MVYEPREDSYFLESFVRSYAKGHVLDMGTGTGILAEAAKEYAVKVTGADIDPEAIRQCCGKHKGIEFIQSDLFSKIPKKKFDLIMFNPPYLPDDERARDIALDGGRHGYELIWRFLDSVRPYLKAEAKILLLFSSFTRKEKIDEAIARNCLEAETLGTKKLDFEKLYAYLIRRSKLLKSIESEGITDVRLFAHGHRGMVWQGIFKGRKVAIKSKKPGSEAIGTIKKEASFLAKLNKHGIGPKLIIEKAIFLAYWFVEGTFIVDYIQKNRKENIVDMLGQIFDQLHKLDTLGINKQEMHHPVKHIIIDNNKPALLDFERARYTEKPKNITQFCQFLRELIPELAKKGIEIKEEKLKKASLRYSKDLDMARLRRTIDIR